MELYYVWESPGAGWNSITCTMERNNNTVIQNAHQAHFACPPAPSAAFIVVPKWRHTFWVLGTSLTGSDNGRHNVRFIVVSRTIRLRTVLWKGWSISSTLGLDTEDSSPETETSDFADYIFTACRTFDFTGELFKLYVSGEPSEFRWFQVTYNVLY